MNYKVSRFNHDLTSAIDQEIECSGGFIYVLDATDLTTVINIKTDTRQNDAIPLKKSYGIVATFSKFYLSAPAQPGKSITLIVTSSVDDFRIFEQAQNTDINTLATIINPVVISNINNPVSVSGITNAVDAKMKLSSQSQIVIDETLTQNTIYTYQIDNLPIGHYNVHLAIGAAALNTRFHVTINDGGLPYYYKMMTFTQLIDDFKVYNPDANGTIKLWIVNNDATCTFEGVMSVAKVGD